MSQQHACVSQGRICSDNFTCCHTKIQVADQTFYPTQSQYTDTGLTSPSTDPIMPGMVATGMPNFKSLDDSTWKNPVAANKPHLHLFNCIYSPAQCFNSLLLVMHLCLDLLQLALEATDPILGQVDIGLEKIWVIFGTSETGVGVHWGKKDDSLMLFIINPLQLSLISSTVETQFFHVFSTHTKKLDEKTCNKSIRCQQTSNMFTFF